MTGAALSAHGLRVLRGDTVALDGIDFTVLPGWTAVVGPNGAGKSTLLSALAGLLPIAAGEVRLGDRPIAQCASRQRARHIAWLGQGEPSASADFTAHDVVMLGRLPRLGFSGSPTATDIAAVDAALCDVGCHALAHRPLQALSGGQRQRVLVARALATEAPVLLLDEPAAHLDPLHLATLVRLLRARAQAGVAIASVVHDLSIALLADRVALLRGGRIACVGGPDDPALHGALVDAFEGAIRVLRVDARWVVVPHFDA